MTLEGTMLWKIEHWANTKGSAHALHDLKSDGTWESTTWAEFWAGVRRVGKGLMSLGLEPGSCDLAAGHLLRSHDVVARAARAKPVIPVIRRAGKWTVVGVGDFQFGTITHVARREFPPCLTLAVRAATSTCVANVIRSETTAVSSLSDMSWHRPTGLAHPAETHAPARRFAKQSHHDFCDGNHVTHAYREA